MERGSNKKMDEEEEIGYKMEQLHKEEILRSAGRLF